MSARTNAKIARPGRRKSLIGTVKHSGYELVRKRKPTRKLATMRDYAKIDFKPWKPDESGQLVPSAKTMYSLGVTARLAFATVLRTATS